MRNFLRLLIMMNKHDQEYHNLKLLGIQEQVIAICD